MSTAPRTDAELFDPVHYSDQGGSSYGQMRRAADGDYVPSELARQLERELAEARKELWNTISAMADLCAENVEAKKDSARLEMLVDLLDVDFVLCGLDVTDFIDVFAWEAQGGNNCAETRRAWRAAIDAAMAEPK